ncbi:ABC transporter ATP-binding protein [Paenibacillus radicis (ex Gao et al. 2016)]|uniref:ABC transporter ATP-binding protein n=1 Tax=Paenibacillus radicis (ex Gao et al. 2016) TaxID=1737354 RepID=A0A917GXJ8_9BACL|nr:ABC transporter ATP-binding protein [Paenibacillus radicis (ex Gao et al. 2016)]GGG60210.1 ABC transporter ATP-binding protein [Paenibacillus radicis (ex Gao et al. 2016)]
MSSIVLENVEKKYGDKSIIENLNLTIESGSFTVLVGPSGCGKSTTLRMIAGLEENTGGTIFIGGQNMNKVEPGKRNLAMVFQNYALYPTMTVEQNIEYGLKNNKVPKEERKRLIEDIAETVGITKHLHKKPEFLSGGERQRLALARAMVKKPAIFLMDEPLSNLDAKLRQQMRTELIELHKKLGATFVYVTHDQVEAMSMGTKIVLMDGGKVMQEDTPRRMYQQPDNIFSSKFIGTPAMNILELQYSQNALQQLAPKGAKYVGFRPEKIKFNLDAIEPAARNSVIAFEGVLTAREILGAETIYKADLDRSQNIAIKCFDSLERDLSKTTMYVEPTHLAFFDNDEKRIYGTNSTSKSSELSSERS